MCTFDKNLPNLGLVLFDAGDLDAGIATTEEAIAINRELGKEGGYKAMFDLHNLGQIERTAGRLDAAEGHAREALAIVDRLAGTSHPHRASVLGSLALIKRAKKEFAAGEQFEREALVQKALVERMMARAGGGAGAGAGGAGGARRPDSAPTPDLVRVIQLMEERAAHEYRSIYHNGQNATNCSTNALQ